MVPRRTERGETIAPQMSPHCSPAGASTTYQAEAPTRSDAQHYDGKSSTPLQKTFAPSPVTGPLEMEASGAGHAPGRLADVVRDDPSRAAVGHSPSHVSARDCGMTLDYFNVMSALLFLRFSSAAAQSSLRTHIAPTLVYIHIYIYIHTYIYIYIYTYIFLGM